MYTKEQLESETELVLASIGKEFGLSLNPDRVAKTPMIEQILAAQSGSPLGEELAKPVVVKPTIDKASVGMEEIAPDGPKWRVVIHAQEGVDNTPFVPIGVNGYVYQVPRDTEVELPEAAVAVLKNAVAGRAVQEEGKTVFKEVNRFPYTILGKVA